MGFSRTCGVFLCLALALPAAAFAPQEERAKESLVQSPPLVTVAGERLTTNELTTAGVAARSFLDAHGGDWSFYIDRRTDRFKLIQGSGIPMLPGRGNDLRPEELKALDLPDGQLTLGAVEPLIRAFVDRNHELIGPVRGTLELDGEQSGIRDSERLISIYYNWHVDGVPVEGARAFVRLNSGNITQFGSYLIGPIDLDTRVVVDDDEAVRLLLDYTGDDEVGSLRGDPELIVQPENVGRDGLDYRLVWKIVYRVRGRLETWEGRVDAHTGEVVAFRDLNAYARVVGGVYPRTVYDENEGLVFLPLTDVTVNGTTMTADVAGEFPYSGGTVTSGLNGRFFDTNCQGCSDPQQPDVEINFGNGLVNFGLGGEDEIGNGFSTPADRNSFYHLNQVRRVALYWYPSLGFLSQTNFTSNINIQDTCNAVYTGNAVNFFRSGGGCNNTGEISDVMSHEYGHGIDQNSNGGDGATGEGTADLVAIMLTHDSWIGPGFHTDGTPVRDINKATTSKGMLSVGNIASKCSTQGNTGPLGYEVHCEGEILGQTAWDISELLAIKHGHHTGWRTSERIFYHSLPDAGHYLPYQSDPIYDAYINADDDDGNLLNGTPNADVIFEAFDLHGIANDEVPTSPGCARPGQPVLTVTPQCDRFDLSWSSVSGADHYDVLRMEYVPDSNLFFVVQVPSSQTTYTDSEVMPGVDYWYTVMAIDAGDCESTVESPVPANLPEQSILSVSAAVADDEPRGNRSGFADPGEEVDVHVTLQNVGQLDATAVSGLLVSDQPGVTILEPGSDWPDLPASGGTAANLDDLRFQTDAESFECGEVVNFRFLPSDISGCASDDSFFSVTLGERFAEIADDFESDLGWQPDEANSTAPTGQWVLGDPDPTTYQPGDDVTVDGTDCWFTAPNGGGDGTDDVDDGLVILLSPVYDLTGLEGADAAYYRWYANSETGVDPDDFFKADVSDDGGQNWTNLETLDETQSVPSWTRKSFHLEDHIALTNQVMFRFQVSDGITTGSIIEAAIDEFRIERYVCDDTPACFEPPTFAGLGQALPGISCGEVQLAWDDAVTNCVNAEISYNVYRDTAPGFVPGPEFLVAQGIVATSYADFALEPGQTYFYIVRAFDSRSGEDENLIMLSAVPPTTPDIRGPSFDGVESVISGDACGETVLAWSTAVETCSNPVAYDIYRSADPGFIPGPENLVATTYQTSFLDVAMEPGVEHTYVVRARDDAGNAETNNVHLSAEAALLDLIAFQTEFEPDDAGWSVVDPDDATAGNWQWGNPSATPYQSEDDATPDGVSAWITGLAPSPGNGDVDGGTTTLLSNRYDLSSVTGSVVRYSRWFTNDRGGSPGDATDTFLIEVSNDDGGSWSTLEDIGAGTPLEWVPVERTVPVAGTGEMRFRFTARDLGAGSLVEAGVDDFSLVAPGEGCNDCGITPDVCTIGVNRSGDDIVVSWSVFQGAQFVVYTVAGCDEQVKLGTTEVNSFVHEGAALSSDAFNYRVTTVDDCGNEQPFCGTTDCP